VSSRTILQFEGKIGFPDLQSLRRHSTALTTSRPSDGAFALYTAVQANKAALLPSHVPYTSGVVVPFALEAAVCALSVREPGPCMPGVLTPALALPYPSLHPSSPPTKILIVNGAASSVGSTTTQIAAAAGITVFAISSARNFELAKQSGASQVFDRHDPSLVETIVSVVRATGLEFVGVFDAISTPENYAQDLEILRALGGESHLACTHPPPTEGVPVGVKTGMIFAVNDVVAPVFRDFVTPALESGLLKCLPAPTVVGKGLEFINEALKRSKAEVSGTKLVVEV